MSQWQWVSTAGERFAWWMKAKEVYNTKVWIIFWVHKIDDLIQAEQNATIESSKWLGNRVISYPKMYIWGAVWSQTEGVLNLIQLHQSLSLITLLQNTFRPMKICSYIQVVCTEYSNSENNLVWTRDMSYTVISFNIVLFHLGKQHKWLLYQQHKLNSWEFVTSHYTCLHPSTNLSLSVPSQLLKTCNYLSYCICIRSCPSCNMLQRATVSNPCWWNCERSLRTRDNCSRGKFLSAFRKKQQEMFMFFWYKGSDNMGIHSDSYLYDWSLID